MKNRTLFLVWTSLTVILTFSIVGVILFVPNGTIPSTWMQIGLKLIDKIPDD